MGSVIALDFETSDRWADSACALGLTKIENGVITVEHRLRFGRHVHKRNGVSVHIFHRRCVGVDFHHFFHVEGVGVKQHNRQAVRFVRGVNLPRKALRRAVLLLFRQGNRFVAHVQAVVVRTLDTTAT